MKIMNISNYFFLLVLFTISPLSCQDITQDNGGESSLIQNAMDEQDKEEEEKDILFHYENEDITTIINKLATLKDINVIFPPGETLNTKVTLHIDEKITISQAWELLNTLLDVTGFFILPQGSIIRIIKTTKDMSREPMPTYIGVHPDDLPNSDQPIRYLYYLANIKVSDSAENELNGILKDILPENTFAKADAATNGLILIAKANDIRGVMRIIMELDRIDFQEKMDIIPL